MYTSAWSSVRVAIPDERGVGQQEKDTRKKRERAHTESRGKERE